MPTPAPRAVPSRAALALRASPVLAAALLLAPSRIGPAQAQTTDSQVNPATATEAGSLVLIRAKKVIVRPGQELENAEVLVDQGRIRAVGTGLTVPEGTQVLEAPVVCAGFLDAWSQLGLDPGVLQDRSAGAATRIADGLDLYSQGYLFDEILRAGITGVRVQGALPSRLSGLGVVLRSAPTDSAAADQRVLSETAGLWVTATDGDAFDRLDAVERFVSAIEGGRKYAEAQVKYEKELAEWQKKITEEEAKLEKDFKNAKKKRDKAVADAKEKGKEFSEEKYKEDKAPKAPRFDRDNEVLARIASGMQPAFLQADRLPEIRALIEARSRLSGVRVVLVGALEAHLCAAELASAGIPVLMAPGDTDAGQRFGMSGLDRAAILERAGVYLLFGSGPGSPYAARDLPLAAAQAVSEGLRADSALAALTLRPARILGLEGELGSVEAGKSADLLLLSGDPLKASSRVQAVLSQGRVLLQP